jgi:hypothetical protein
MASVVPVAKALYLCDDILSDPTRVKPHLIGVLNAIRPPAFPHVIPRLCDFAQLIGGYGEVRCVVRVVNAHNQDVAYQSSERLVRFDDRLQTRYFSLRLEQVTIHTPGDFWVEFTCNDQFVDDAVLRILEGG